jgi:hypothetical protein
MLVLGVNSNVIVELFQINVAYMCI